MLDVFTKVVLAGACLSAFAWVILVQRRTIKRLSDAYLRLTHFQRVLVALAVIVCTVYAQKPSTNDVEGVRGTNEELRVESDELMTGQVLMSSTLHSSFLTLDSDSAVPYRLESVLTNEGYSYAMPADGTIRGTWHVRGAYEDVVKVGLGGSGGASFRFPLGNGLCTSLWVHTWGKVRPQLKNASNEIAAVGAPMSAIPDVSRFWTMATSNDTYLLTWENFTVGRINGEAASSPLQDGIAPPLTSGEDTASPFLNAQIELKRNGDFITRSNDVECVYRHVIEPNPISPINPVDPDNPMMPLHPYGPVQDLSVIEEPNAYCWVDIVVNTADAWVHFAGDGASNLADPSFAAKAGETNHVVLLIGKTYKVTCDMPFTVVDKSDPAIDEWWENDNTLWLNWPVDIWSEGDEDGLPLLLFLGASNGSGGGHGFTMFVSPSGIGGDFSWTNVCCSVSGSGYYFSYDCDDDCHCGGCAASGYFSYEGYRLPAWGGSCGCSYEDESDDDGDDDDDDDEPPPVGVSASFSKRVIFLENEYANTTNEVAPWYSDTSSLSCTAWGGENGGHVRISIAGDSNLIQYGGQSLPIERDLEPYEVFAFTNTYKAVSESSGYEAIVVTATFDENDTDWSETSIAKATAVRVEVTPERTVNGCLNRHKWGACERIICEATPSGQFLEFDASNGGDIETGVTGSSSPTLVCPDFAASGLITITVDGESYTPATTVETPASFRFGVVRQLPSALGSGVPGGAGMSIEVYVQPDYVSFMELRMREVPSNDSDIFGYFTNTVFSEVWYHNRKRGAGTWHLIGLENYFFTDEAKMMDALITPCLGGRIYWTIPIDWKRNGGPNGLDHRLVTIQQKFDMSASGTLRVSKFGFWVERAIDGLTSRSEGVLP